MSKKYYWNWDSDAFMDEDIDLFLEVSKKKSNQWWKNLPVTAHDIWHTPLAVFRGFSSKYFSTGETTTLETTATAKTCPAIGNGILDKAILVKAPCDIFLSINENGGAFWNINETSMIDIKSHPSTQFYSKDKNPFYNKINFKFTIPIIISPGNDTCMFLQPQYHLQNYPFEVVNGSIKPYRNRIAVNTLIEIPKEQTEYHIKAGTILAYMWFDNNNIILEKDNKLKILPPRKFYGQT